MSLATNPLANRRQPSARVATGLAAFGATVAIAGGAQAQAGGALGAGVPGVPAAGKRIAVEVHADATYDSNVTGGNASVANLRNLKPEDEIYSAGTNVTLTLPSSRQLLFFDGQADINRYARNSVLDAENYRLALGAAERLGLCSGTLVGAYSHREIQIQQVAVADTAKNLATDQTANVDITCGRRSIFVDLQASVDKAENSAKSSGFGNSVTTGGNLAVGYHGKTLGDIAVMAVYSNIHYDPADLLLSPIPGLPTQVPDVQQYGAGIRYSRKVGLRLSGTASVFYDRIQGGLTHTQSDGLNVNAQLTYRLTSRTNFALNYVIGNNASPLTTTSYVHTENLQFSATYNMTKRIGLEADVSHQREEYRGGDQIALLQLRESDTNQIDGSVNIQVGRKISVVLKAAHLERTADVPQFNYNSDRVSISLSGKF